MFRTFLKRPKKQIVVPHPACQDGRQNRVDENDVLKGARRATGEKTGSSLLSWQKWPQPPSQALHALFISKISSCPLPICLMKTYREMH